MQRDLFGEVLQQTAPFGIEFNGRKASLLQHHQTLLAKLSVGSYFRANGSQQVPRLFPSLVFRQPLDQNAPSPAVPGHFTQQSRHLRTRSLFISLRPANPSQTAHRWGRITKPVPYFPYHLLCIVIAALLHKQHCKPVCGHE